MPQQIPASSHFQTAEEVELRKLANGQEFWIAAVVLGLSIVGLVRELQMGRMPERVERRASPDGGAAQAAASAVVPEAPPPVS